MIPLKDITFDRELIRDGLGRGNTILRGHLDFHWAVEINDFEMAKRPGIVDRVKADIKRHLWHQTYGELTAPLEDLIMWSRINCPHGQREELDLLIADVRAKLEMPK